MTVSSLFRASAVALVLSAPVVQACDCITLPAKQAKLGAEVVFRGTITGFRDSSNGDRLVVFRVSRVWKGRVTEVFEMPAIQESQVQACMGFLPRLDVGSELIVYAHRFVPSDIYYFPIVCNTMLVKDAKDIAELGRGNRPRTR